MAHNPSPSGANRISFNKLLDESPWSAFQKGILALMALAFLTDGIANQSLGLAIPALMADWGLPREAFANVAAIGLVGLTCGALVGGMLGDRFGRRTMLIVSTGFFGFMTMAQAWAGNTGELLVLRFLDGIGIGAMIPNGAAMIAEFTPRRERALALGIGMTFVAVGSMAGGLIGAFLIEPYGWEGLFVVLGSIGVAVASLMLLLLPESPIYLVNTRPDQTKVRAIAARCGLAVGERVIEADAQPADAPRRAPLSELFAPGVASSTAFLWLAFFFILLANYAMFSWIPAMLAGLGFALSTTGLGMTALSFGGIVGGVVSGWLIKRFGSRGALLALGAGGVATALALGLMIRSEVQGLETILTFLVLIGFFSGGLLNGLYTYSALIYPDHARGTGVGAAAAAGRVGAIASSYVGVIALGMGGAASYFLVIAGCLFVSLASTALIRRQIAKAA